MFATCTKAITAFVGIESRGGIGYHMLVEELERNLAELQGAKADQRMRPAGLCSQQWCLTGQRHQQLQVGVPEDTMIYNIGINHLIKLNHNKCLQPY